MNIEDVYNVASLAMMLNPYTRGMSRAAGRTLARQQLKSIPKLKSYNVISTPVIPSTTPARWRIPNNQAEYVIPQTPEENYRLLTKHYPKPNWQQLGIIAESSSPHYSGKDTSYRTSILPSSQLVRNIKYDANRNLASLRLGNKEYTYAATPEQFQRFMQSGSLGGEVNNIKYGIGNSLRKTNKRM